MWVAAGGDWADAYRSAAMPLHLNTCHRAVSFGENVERARVGSCMAPEYTGVAFSISASDNVIGVGYWAVRDRASTAKAPESPAEYHWSEIRPRNLNLGNEKGSAENVAGPSCCNTTAFSSNVELHV